MQKEFYFKEELPIFASIKRFEPRVELMIEAGLEDDLFQEIRLTLLINHNETFQDKIRACHNAIESLMHRYGWRKRGRKELRGGDGDRSQNINKITNYEKQIGDFWEDRRNKILKHILDYYENHTARETCEQFNIEFNPQITKLLHLCNPKQMGLGGKRKGAGRKNKYGGVLCSD